jgi:hypothetical protein
MGIAAKRSCKGDDILKKSRRFVALILSFILIAAIFPITVLAGPEVPGLPAVSVTQEHMGNHGGNEIFRMVVSARAPGGIAAFDVIMSYDNGVIFPVESTSPYAEISPPPSFPIITFDTSLSIEHLASAELPLDSQFWVVSGGRTGFHFGAFTISAGISGSTTTLTPIFAFYFTVLNNDLSLLNPNSIRIEAADQPGSLLSDNPMGGTRFTQPGVTLLTPGFDEYIWGPNDPSALPPGVTEIPDTNKISEHVGARSVTVGTQTGTLTAGSVGTVTFAVTSDGIPAGIHDITVTGLPGTVTVQSPGTLTIDASGAGTLTLAGAATIVAGSHNLTLVFDDFYAATWDDGLGVLNPASPVASNQFTLTIGAAPSVAVGAQVGTMTAGTAGTVTYPVTTSGIADGTYAAVVANLPGGITVQGQVTIASNSGILTLVGGTATVAGVTSTLTLTIDGVTSPSFTLTIAAPTENIPPLTQLAPPANLDISGTILSWNAITNASGYRVYVGGQAVSGTIIATSFNLETLNLGAGTHFIQVRAIGDTTNFTNSALSSALNFVVQIAQPPTDDGNNVGGGDGDEAGIPVGRPAASPRPVATPAPTPAPTPTPTPPQPEQAPGVQQAVPSLCAHQLFDDIAQGSWYHSYVSAAVQNNLFQGTAPRIFGPQANMTRAMFVQVLANLNEVDLTTYGSMTPSFNDVSPGSWYFAAVEWAESLGIVQGIGEDNFAPNAPITREQIAVMLYRYVQIMDVELPHGTIAAFADHANISSWATEAVEAIQAAGIVSGRPDGTFDPQATATRAEVAAIFVRLLDVMQ